MVSSLHLSSSVFSSSMLFSFRLFLGVFVLEGIFLKFYQQRLNVCVAAMVV